VSAAVTIRAAGEHEYVAIALAARSLRRLRARAPGF
jgi:hypothetical protein